MPTITVAEHKRSVDPEQAREAAKRRHDPRTYARSIVSKWPALDDQVRAELRTILAPVVNAESEAA